MRTAPLTDSAGEAAASAQRVLGRVARGELPLPVLHRLGSLRATLAWTLTPVPVDVVDHLRAAHAEARPCLLRLREHDPGREVPSSNGRYAFTPRKVLRRVLDHALDHLNQIEQWLAWQRMGQVPVPTDGWAPAVVTLAEDRLALAADDLEAWLWRIDQVARLVTQRASALAEAELDWLPPDGGWPLRRVLRHLARAEPFYAGALEHALPGEPAARYGEASRLFQTRLEAVMNAPLDPAVAYVHGFGECYTPQRAVDEILTAEGEAGDG